MPMSPLANAQEYGEFDPATTNNEQFANFDIGYFEQNTDSALTQQYEQQQEQQNTPGQSSINWSGQSLDLFSSQPPLLPNNTPSSIVVVLKLSLNIR